MDVEEGGEEEEKNPAHQLDLVLRLGINFPTITPMRHTIHSVWLTIHSACSPLQLLLHPKVQKA